MVDGSGRRVWRSRNDDEKDCRAVQDHSLWPLPVPLACPHSTNGRLTPLRSTQLTSLSDRPWVKGFALDEKRPQNGQRSRNVVVGRVENFQTDRVQSQTECAA